ncbi:MAG: sugar ABC transporter permease [Clostridiales bacterium]|jgi:multiple sugar transport system permease protein|nr:sugar ABC transporter permease [Clostridiales bacterium]
MRIRFRHVLAFMLPAIAAVAFFAIYPLAYTGALSLQKFNLTSGAPAKFIGLGNYVRLFSDSQFMNSLKVTAIYTIWGVLATMVLGVLLALLLNSKGKLVGFLRAVSLVPMLICSMALSVAWALVYNTNFGALNAILQALGLPTQNFLGTVKTALPSLIAIDVWQFTPYVMILTLAGLKGISPELYEAARIDGANQMQCFWKITIPSLRGVLVTTLVMRVIDTFKTFEKPLVLTNGGPAMSTDTINLHVFNTAFSSWDMGYGSAGSIVITLIIALFSAAFIRLSRKAEN